MIYINNNLRIRKLEDGKNLQLEEYREGKDTHKGKSSTKWRWCGYYGDLQSALMGALSKQLFDSTENEMSIKEVIAKIDAARAEIINAIEKKEKELA